MKLFALQRSSYCNRFPLNVVCNRGGICPHAARRMVQPCSCVHLTEVPSESSTPLTPVQCLKRPKLFLGKVSPRSPSGSRRVEHLAPVARYTDVQNPRWLLETVLAMQMMTHPGFALRHAWTVASCVSASIKSHIPSNNAIPRNGLVVSTLFIYRFLCCVLG